MNTTKDFKFINTLNSFSEKYLEMKKTEKLNHSHCNKNTRNRPSISYNNEYDHFGSFV